MNNKENPIKLLKYCDQFASLKVSNNKKRGFAPYKPVLLLSIIDLISQNIIIDNMILVSDYLIETFNRYWDIIAPDYKGGLHYPFFHLQSDGFWHLTFKLSFNGLQPKTPNKLKEAVEYAKLDDGLFQYLQNPDSRKELIDALISAWFSSSSKKLEEIVKVSESFQDNITEETLKSSEIATESQKFYFRKSLVRDAFFRKAVVQLYDYQCSFCKLRVVRSLRQTIVDGSHIKPLSQFYDNNIDNGICLCKNHHWAFDNGLFTIDNDYKIIMSNNFEELAPNSRPIKSFHGEQILLPNLNKYFPNKQALEWHQENIFKT